MWTRLQDLVSEVVDQVLWRTGTSNWRKSYKLKKKKLLNIKRNKIHFPIELLMDSEPVLKLSKIVQTNCSSIELIKPASLPYWTSLNNWTCKGGVSIGFLVNFLKIHINEVSKLIPLNSCLVLFNYRLETVVTYFYYLPSLLLPEWAIDS